MRKYRTLTKRLFAGIIDAVLFAGFDYALTQVFTAAGSEEWFLQQVITHAVAIFYVIFCVGKYGQTIGKFAMGVKLYRLDERSVIGYKRAFFREAVPIAVNVAMLLVNYLDLPEKELADSIIGWINFSWFLLVFITMFINPRRRGVQDLMASSIAVDVDEQQRELKELAKQNAS